METESAVLLPNKPKRTKQWSTSQLLLVSFIVAIIVGIASNLDRIIDSISEGDSASDSSSPSVTDAPSTSPTTPYPTTDPTEAPTEMIWPESFGHNIYAYFSKNETQTDMNWGSYGGAPTIVHELHQNLQYEIASCPQCFFSGTKYELQDEVLDLLSTYMNIQNSSDLVFVDNASHGVNAILKSIAQNVYEGYCNVNITNNYQHSYTNKTCKILSFNTAYAMVPETLKWINDSLSAKDRNIWLIFDVTLEMLEDPNIFLESLREFIVNNTNENNQIYMSIISEITAFPAVIYDVKSILELFHEYNILGLIDAAHSLGQIDIDIQDMNPDFYIVTGYKWFYSPLSSGCLYTRHELQKYIVPTTISNLGQGSTEYIKYFSYQGTMDYSAWISMKYALEFRGNITSNIGNGTDKEIEIYNHNLVIEGGKLVADIWNTSLLITNEDVIPNMVNVILPSQNPLDITPMYDALRANKITTRGGPPFQGIWFIRLCAQIFLELSDFEDLAYIVLDALDT